MAPRKQRPRKAERPYVRQPDREPVSVEHAVDEGILITRSALTMEVKNHIIVTTLRDDQLFDPDVTSAFVIHELEDLAAEQAEYATRMDDAALIAIQSKGTARHQHDYHTLDLPALSRRSEIYSSLSLRLLHLATDHSFVSGVVETAREKAWDEVGGAIENRLEKIFSAEAFAHTIASDPDYERERETRIAMFLALDLAVLAPQAG